MRATKIAAWTVGVLFLSPCVMFGVFWWRSRCHVVSAYPAPVSGRTFLWLALAGAASVALLANPRRAWWLLLAWRFKNPEANEPSDAFYVVLRLAGLIGAVAVAVAAVEQYLDDREYQERERAWHSAASGLRDEPSSRTRSS